MDLGTAISTCFKKYFDFTGRASKSEFWYFVLFVFILLFGAGVLLGIFMPNNTSYDQIVAWVIYLPLIVPLVAVTARRIHDFGMSGWMQCIFIPGFMADEFLGTGYVIYIVTFAIWAIYCSQGATKGKNRFGLKPKK